MTKTPYRTPSTLVLAIECEHHLTQSGGLTAGYMSNPGVAESDNNTNDEDIRLIRNNPVNWDDLE